MSQSLTESTKWRLKERVGECLRQNAPQKLVVKEIARWIMREYPAACRAKRERSRGKLDADKALLVQLRQEIYADKPETLPNVRRMEDSPKRYYWTESSADDEIDYEEKDTSSPEAAAEVKIKEHDLYPKLSIFLKSELNLFSKRIDEKQSTNSRGPGGNEWLYPDLVGMEALNERWHREIRDCVRQIGDKRAKLWSFEVKLYLNNSNVRRAFFQAVSNSSWANFGYLVASEIDSGAMQELRMLSSLHGIGVIRLDVENPSESQIMIPARERDEIDWDIANRLAQANRNFLNCIKSVRKFHQTGDVSLKEWDAVKEGE